MITKELFGTLSDGRKAELFTLKNDHGSIVKISSFGGVIQSILVPDKNGVLGDVALGLGSLAGYEQPCDYFGALIGRHANRIGGCEFVLGGKTYKLYDNDGGNHLHGGKCGFDKKLWDAQIVGDVLSLHYLSVDMEEGYPGNLNVTVNYSFNNENELKIDYSAVSDKDTVVNLTNHCYFNLAGHDAGSIADHKLKINADFYTEGGPGCLPTGVIAAVKGTPMDFTEPHKIGERIGENCSQLKDAGGYDHNFVLRKAERGELSLAAEVLEESTGRMMSVYTTMPGIQLYSGNMISGAYSAKGGAKYKKRGALCLETQYFPNAMQCTHFPSPVLKAREMYHHTTIYQFSAK